jgi:hypothetical protein
MLLGYKVGSQIHTLQEHKALIAGIADDPSIEGLGAVAHLFQIEADGRTFRVIVEGSNVRVIEM